MDQQWKWRPKKNKKITKGNERDTHGQEKP